MSLGNLHSSQTAVGLFLLLSPQLCSLWILHITTNATHVYTFQAYRMLLLPVALGQIILLISQLRKSEFRECL